MYFHQFKYNLTMKKVYFYILYIIIYFRYTFQILFIIIMLSICIIVSKEMFECKRKFETYQGVKKCITPSLKSCEFNKVILYKSVIYCLVIIILLIIEWRSSEMQEI